MNKYSRKFLKNCFVIIAFCIIFAAWQINSNPEDIMIITIFTPFLFIIGIILNGFLAVLSSIEEMNKEKGDEEDEEQNLK